MSKAVGILELSSIAKGMETGHAMQTLSYWSAKRYVPENFC